MAGTLVFDMAAVRPLIAATLAAKEHRPTLDQLFDQELRKDGKVPSIGAPWPTLEDLDLSKIPPALWLVKEHGVYLMSSAKLPEGEKPTVVYAEGLNPAAADSDHWYDVAHAICGGDDFAEALPVSMIPRDSQQFTKLLVRMEAQSLTLLAQ